MGITYSAGTGAVINSYAMDETLVDQTQQTNDNTVVVSDDIVTAGNGQINASYYGTYVGRKVVIDLDETGEQERIVVSQATGTGNTIILTVHEDWDTNPVATTGTIHVFYTVPDIDEAGGIGYNTKTGIWECTNEIRVGNGTDDAGLHIGDYLAIEFDDQGTTDDFTVFEFGRFDIGYLVAGVPLGGGHLTFYDNADGEKAGYFSNGSGKWYDAYVWSQLSSLELDHVSPDSRTEIVGCKLINVCYNYKLANNSDYGNIFQKNVYVGSHNVNDLVAIPFSGFSNPFLVCEDLTFVKIHSVMDNGSGGPRRMKNCVWIDCTNYITILNNDDWVVINPTWGVTSHSDITDAAVTGLATMHDGRSVDVKVATADGTAINLANVLIYEGLVNDALSLEEVSDTDGLVSGYFSYRFFNWVAGVGSTATYGTWAFRVDKWLYFPAYSAQLAEPREGTVTLLPDPNILETNQATAISDGAGMIVGEVAIPNTLFEFTGGTGALAAGMDLTFDSGATGTFQGSLVNGDDTAGTMFLTFRNATAIANGDTFSRTGGTAGTFSATYTNDSQHPFSRFVATPPRALQTIYDWLAAVSATNTLTTTGKAIHRWGRDEQARMLYNNGGVFSTERSHGLGVMIIGYTTGDVSHFTDDNGDLYIPPTTVTVEVHVIDDATGLDLELAHCYLIDDATKTEVVLSAATNSSGLASASYVGTVPLAVSGWVRQNDIVGVDYVQQDISGTITTGGLSLTVRLKPI